MNTMANSINSLWLAALVAACSSSSPSANRQDGGAAGAAGATGATGGASATDGGNPTLPECITSASNAYWQTATLTQVSSGTATVTVNDGSTAQTWEGFGGAF